MNKEMEDEAEHEVEGVEHGDDDASEYNSSAGSTHGTPVIPGDHREDKKGQLDEDEGVDEDEEVDDDEEEMEADTTLDPAAHRECLLDTMVAITDSLMAVHQDLKALTVGGAACKHSEENHGHHSDAQQLEMRRTALYQRLSRVARTLLQGLYDPGPGLRTQSRRDAYRGAMDRMYGICRTFGEARWNDAGDNFGLLSVSVQTPAQ